MLPSKNRISRKEFPAHKAQGIPNQLVRGSAVKFFSPYFSAIFYNGAVESRASVVVSKKTAKTAVARNLLRRRFYDLLAPYFKTMSVPTTVVIYPKTEAINAQFSVLKIEIENALMKARLIK